MLAVLGGNLASHAAAPFPAQHPLLLHPLSVTYTSTGRPTGRVSSRGGSRGAGLSVWRSTRRGDECLFPVPEHEPREGRRHTRFIPTAPPTRAVYPNLLHPVDAQRTSVPLGFTVNEAELTSVAPPVSTQPRGVALGTACFRPRGAGGVRSFPVMRQAGRWSRASDDATQRSSCQMPGDPPTVFNVRRVHC